MGIRKNINVMCLVLFCMSVSITAQQNNSKDTLKNNIVTKADLISITNEFKVKVPKEMWSRFSSLSGIILDSVNSAIQQGRFSSKKAYLDFFRKNTASVAKHYNSKEYKATLEIKSFLRNKATMTQRQKDSFLLQYDKKYKTNYYEMFRKE